MGIFDKVGSFAHSVGSFVSNAGHTIKEDASSVFHSVGSGIGKAAHEVKEDVVSVGESIGSGLGKAASKTGEVIGEAFDKVEPLAEKVINAPSNFVSGISTPLMIGIGIAGAIGLIFLIQTGREVARKET